MEPVKMEDISIYKHLMIHPMAIALQGNSEKKQEALKGIPIGELKKLVAQIDLSAFATEEMYEISIMGIYKYKNENLSPNDYQAGIEKFVFENSVLNEHKKKTIDGEYLLMVLNTMSQGNGATVAYIFCEVQAN